MLFHFHGSALNCIDSSFHFFFQRREIQPVMKTPKLTKKMMIVASAFIFGLTARRTQEKTFIGKIFEPCPETKLTITKSSNDNVKPKSHAASRTRAMMSRVITKKLSSEWPQNPLLLLQLNGRLRISVTKE